MMPLGGRRSSYGGKRVRRDPALEPSRMTVGTSALISCPKHRNAGVATIVAAATNQQSRFIDSSYRPDSSLSAPLAGLHSVPMLAVSCVSSRYFNTAQSRHLSHLAEIGSTDLQ